MGRQCEQLDRRTTVLWVLLITGLGAALRLAALGSVPGGLYQDEAFNGLDALRVLEGEHKLYFSANNGREPLFIYLASITIAWLGRTPAAVRLPAALLGTLTIPTTAALGSVLFNRRVGLLAAALLAITFWPLHLSRVAFRAVGLPLFLGLALAAGWRGARQASKGWTLAGGMCYGLAFYTYLPVYWTPVVLAFFTFYLWATGCTKRRTLLRLMVPCFVLGALLPLLPLAVANPNLLFGRTAQVSILNPAVNQGDLWSALLQQIGRGLGMFFWRGDTIPRHNLPGRPVFDLLATPFFLAGLFWTGRNWRRPAAALTLLWTLLMLVPTILAQDTPHFLRGVGVLPVATLLPAVGLERVQHWLRQKPIHRWLPPALTAVALAGILGLTLRDYFGRYAADPLTGYAFQNAAVELAGQINNSVGSVWASERFEREWEAIPYLVADKKVRWLADGELPQPTTLPAALFLWPYKPVEPQLAALPTGISLRGWQGPLIKGDLEPAAYPLYWAYRLETATATPAEPLARFANGIRLESATIAERTPDSAQYDATGHLRNTSSAGRNTSSAGRDMSSAGRNTSNAGRDMSNAGRDTSNAGRDMSNAGRDMSSALHSTSDAQGNTSSDSQYLMYNPPLATRHSLHLTLYWTTAQELDADYIVFVHLVNAAGIVAQDDALPAAGALPTSWWRPGNWIVDQHIIALPSSYNPEKHQVLVGLYQSDNRERLAVLDPAGHPVRDAVVLAPAGTLDE